MLELVLPQGTVMLDVLDLNRCVLTRQTGQKFKVKNNELRVCKLYKTHSQNTNRHDVFNKGAPYPKLETFQDVKNALVKAGILCQQLSILIVLKFEYIVTSAFAEMDQLNRIVEKDYINHIDCLCKQALVFLLLVSYTFLLLMQQTIYQFAPFA